MKFRKVRLYDLCSIVTDYVANGSFKTLADKVKYLNEGYARVIRLVDYNNKYSKKDSIWVSKESYEFLKKSKLYGGEIVLTNVGANLGTVFIAPQLEYPTTLGPNAIMIKTNENDKYLYYWLKSKNGQNTIKSIVTGSAMPKFNKTDLKNIEIAIPCIEDQDKIVEILSKIDKKIELNNQTNDNLQKLVNGLYIKYFVNFDGYIGEYKDTDLGMIPEIFNVDTLGNVITFSNGYGWNSKDMLDVGSEDTYKVFKMANINIGGGINKSKTKSWIEKDKTSNLEQYITKKGDILMCMTDMKNSGNPLLGHTALIDKDDEFVINQRVGIIRCNKGLGYSYIYTMSNLKYFINDIRSRANSGVQVNLTTKGICDTLVLVPDDNTLNKFQQVAEPLYEKIFNNNNENETLEQLRDTLLPKLMNGEIDLDKIEI